MSRRSLSEGGAAVAYISLFQRFGDALISADSVLTSYEVEAFADYLNALRSYQECAPKAPSAES